MRGEWGRVSTSGVQWVNEDSDLAEVLSLVPLCKRLRALQGKLPPAWGPQTPNLTTENCNVGQQCHEKAAVVAQVE